MSPSGSLALALRLRAAFRCWALGRRWTSAAAAIASPNSVLSEHAFKLPRLGAGSDDEDDHGYGSDREGPAAVEGDKHELAISRPGHPAQLVATLEKRGITHLFPIQLRLPGNIAFVLPWRVILYEQEGAEESNAGFAWESLVFRGRLCALDRTIPYGLQITMFLSCRPRRSDWGWAAAWRTPY
ncbi:hypothetical protein ZWY2020_038413 [Hordeum vulgare]|nr:hypothetical protein ZWY2020_038413 [Hordeum vulgare]